MKKIAFILLVVFLLSPIRVDAHSGRTDAYGCHNCYTSYCYGEYHCHGGGSYVPPAPRYVLPAPVNPQNGTWDYKTSGDNWCNYNLTINWDKPLYGDRFSIAVSKYAGADPGPLVDTTSLSYTFENLTPGKWYINVKTGNSERWSAVSYWTVDLPTPTPSLYASIESVGDSQYLNYQISCLDKVEGVDEFINYLKTNNNQPQGKVLLPYSAPTSLTIKGWDKSGREYKQDLSFSPIVAAASQQSNSTESDNSDWYGILALGFAGGAIWFGLWILNKVKAAWNKMRGHS